MRKKLVSIILSIMVAVTFMPLSAEYSFAEESFDPGAAPGGIKVAGYTYRSVHIVWNGVNHAKGYKVYRATKKTGRYNLAATVTSNGFNDTKNRTLGKYKYYKIRAFGDVSGKTVLGPNSGVFRAKPGIPAATGLRTSGGNGQITFAWNKVSGAKKYRVYRATSPNGKYTRIATTKKCSYTKSATAGKRYYFKVRTYRGSRKSDYSYVVEGLARPPAPAGVKAVQSGDGIQTSWTGVSQAYSYEIYRSENAASNYRYLAGVKGTSYTDTQNLEDGKTYFYKVRALASVNGTTQAGAMSSNSGSSRSAVIGMARAYKGISEWSSKHKDIVNTYNSYVRSGKIGYGDPWCAAFVSAIEIKTGNASLIPIGAYCPTMLKNFARKTYDKSYHPDTADVIFFDGDRNGNADHVGFVDNYDSSKNMVTTIEGNYSDSVKCRTFTPGNYRTVLAYGLPAYPDSSGVTYVATQAPAAQITSVAGDVSEAEVQEAVQKAEAPVAEPEMTSEVGVSAEAQADVPEAEGTGIVATDNGSTAEKTQQPVADAETRDYNKVVALADYVQDVQPAAETDAEESTYDAFLVKAACENMGIQACVITEIDTNGNMNSYNEVLLDGQPYILNASKGSELEEYVQEVLQ